MCDCHYRELYAKAAKERDELAAKNKRLVEQKGKLINRIMTMEKAEKERVKADREREKVNSGYIEVCGSVRWVREN